MRVLLALLLLIGSCKKPGPSHSPSDTLTPLEQPVIYARYETLPALLRTKPGACSRAFEFRAPDRYRLRKFMDLCGVIGPKDPWQIPAGVQSFYWEQDLLDNQKIQFELIDSNGIPMPSTVTVSKVGVRVILQLKPGERLPGDKLILLVANLFDASGNKQNSWNVLVKITGNQ